MFIFTARVRRKRLLVTIVLLAIAAAAALLLRNTVSARPASATSGITTNEDRVAYLNSLGLEVSSEPAEAQQVLIPEEFSDVYTNYNELQLDCGFDLTPYQGMLVTRYSYLVLNHGTADEPVYVEILICDDCIIGGDIHSLGLDGFMQGLSPIEQPAESDQTEE